MPKITSSEISSAISLAQAHREINAELRRRDNDNRLDCVYINCEVRSGVDNPVKRFRLIFNYAYVSQTDARGEDIIVEIELRDEAMSILRWTNA